MDIEKIRDRIRTGDYTDHDVKRMIKRSINRQEVENIVLKDDIIEEYPDDKYSPSCLLHGVTEKDRNLHVQISSPPLVVVITVYEPDALEWINFKIRR